MSAMARPSSTSAVAIVGMACRFPGGIDGPDALWRTLAGGIETVSEIPASRMDVARFFDPRPATPGRMQSRRGGFLDGLETFDPEFFGIAPREAATIDPQQRILLELAWEALEDAGQDVRALAGSRTAVYIGQWLSDFEARLLADPERVEFGMTTGSGRYVTSGRISYVFGLQGPSFTLDSACSSSLAAIHLAVRSLRAGECTLALAGGVNVILQPQIHIAYSQNRMMAPDGRCKFGDASGDGYVRSEGAGLVALKTLARALDDGDRIYAVIRGSAVNNDGQQGGTLGRPSQAGQEAVLRAAYADAGVDPARVTYVEAHGTGTRVGDPIELSALGAVMGADRPHDATCFVGSIKTNIGHTEGAAGVAGVMKVALSLFHRRIAASLHFKVPNPGVPWHDLPFVIPTSSVDWRTEAGQSRTAGVSSFGIAGTNAHVVLEEAPPAIDPSPVLSMSGPALLVLSAATSSALGDLAGRYATRLDDDEGPSLHDVCWTAATRRTRLDHRAAFVAGDRHAMAAALRGFVASGPAAAQATMAGATGRRVVFVVPGQGGQWSGMARTLLREAPVFRASIERADVAARPWIDWSIREQIETGAADDAGAGRIDVIQPVLLAVSMAYGELLLSLGVVPSAVVGHSMGEVGAAYLAGALSLDDAMHVICRRSALMRETSGRGAMALVDLPAAAVEARIAADRDRIGVAVSNSPRSSVVSGDPDAVRDLLAQLDADGIFCRLVKVDVASHSPQMDPVAARLQTELDAIRPRAASRTMYSTVRAARIDGEMLDAGYWAENVRRPVRFADTVALIAGAEATLCIELGPHPVLVPAIEQTARDLDRNIAAVGCGRRDEDERPALMRVLATVACAGGPIDWATVTGGPGRVVSLPRYPWQRTRYWPDFTDRSPVDGGRPASALDEESLSWLHQLVWRSAPVPAATGTAAGRWTVVTTDRPDRGEHLAEALRQVGAEVEIEPLATFGRSRSPASHVVVLIPDDDGAAFVPVSALQQVASSTSARLWFVTFGAQSVSDDERVAPWPAAAWGSGRVIAEEHPDRWGGLVDLPIEADARAYEVCAQHLVAAGGEDHAAVRGARRYVQRVVPMPADATPRRLQLDADGACLVTGGLGAIGLLLARRLVECGARRVILVGRRGLPERSSWRSTPADSPDGQRIAAVLALEALGASVHVAAVDVSDEAQLSAFLERYRAEAWPRIRGVIHAAGVLANALVERMDRATFDAGIRAKARGAMLLDAWLPDLDFFVVCSSIGAFVAQAGQANYAAANAAIDAVVADRRARGLPALSIGWGVWAGTGLVDDDAGAQHVAEMVRRGVRPFEPRRGVALFEWLCASPHSSVAVLPIDWPTFARSRGGRAAALFAECLDGSSAVGVQAGAGLDALPANERRARIEGIVRAAVCAVLRLAPSHLEAKKTLGAMGLTSLMAMELRNRLESALGRSLSATIAWNYPTVDALVGHLAGEVAAPAAAPSGSDAGPIVPADVAALSDEQAAAALRRTRVRR